MSSASDSSLTTPNFDTSIFPVQDSYQESYQDSYEDSYQDSRRDSRVSPGDIVPKIEETELQLADVKEEASTEDTPISPTEPVKIRRARGRPRIHPPRSPSSLSKQAKARSKTGCTTCRKRKKKCDETKPFCNTPSTMQSFAYLTVSRSLVSEEQHPLRGLQALRGVEEWQGEGGRWFVWTLVKWQSRLTNVSSKA
jgi:hypothetical protein